MDDTIDLGQNRAVSQQASDPSAADRVGPSGKIPAGENLTGICPSVFCYLGQMWAYMYHWL